MRGTGVRRPGASSIRAAITASDFALSASRSLKS